MGVSSLIQPFLLACAISSVLAHSRAVADDAILEVRRKLPLHCCGQGRSFTTGGGRGCHYAEHLEHDARRHGGFFSTRTSLTFVGRLPTETGLYRARFTSGPPSKNYDMEMDLINWATCDSCPHQSVIGPASSKVFAHCLNTVDGVGIVAIGNVEQLQKTTSFVRPHYIVRLDSVAVAGSTLQLPTDTFYGDDKGAMIDIGTTSVYLPEVMYKAVMIAIFYKHPDTLLWSFRDILYMKHHGRVDDVFPKITFHFDGGLALEIYPHDYLLNNGSDWYSVALRNGRSQPEHMKNLVILGDIVFSNKLVVYDLENQVIGWTDHDCSSNSPVLTSKMSEL